MRLREMINRGWYYSPTDPSGQPGQDPGDEDQGSGQPGPGQDPPSDPGAGLPATEPTTPQGRVYSDADLDRIRQEAFDAAYRTFQAPQAPQIPANPYAEVSELMYTDPEAAIRRTVQIAQQEVMSQIAPVLGRVQQSQVVDTVARDLGPEAQQYVQNLAAQIPGNVDGPLAELLRNAAENVDRRAAERRPHREPAYSQVPSVNATALNDFNAERAVYKLPPITAAEYAALSTDNALESIR